MIKCDLHVHSRYSGKPTNWLAKQYNIPESYTQPQHVYRAALSRGMTHVTITDHDTISGCLEIAHLPNTFISCEVTARFPDDQCKVHVPVYNITEHQFLEIDKLRKNIYELVRYLDENMIWHTIAHPFYSVNNKLNAGHFEQMLLMFDLFELNGARSEYVNHKVKQIVEQISARKLEQLADKYGIRNPKVIPGNKFFICGSDDHCGLYIANAYTSNPSASIDGFFENAESNELVLPSSDPKNLGHVIYSIIYQSLQSRINIDRYVQLDAGLRNISAFMTMQHSSARDQAGTEERPAADLSNGKKGDVEQLLRNAFNHISISAEDLSLGSIGRRWFGFISKAIDESLKDMLEYTFEQFKRGHIFNIFRTVGSISSLYFLSIPYYVSYRVFQETKDLAAGVDLLCSSTPTPKVAHFSDTFHEVNGVALTLRQMKACAQRLGLDYQFISCSDLDNVEGIKMFPPIKVFDLPEYSELKLAFPSVLEVMDYIYEGNFTHLHSATPGPVGLVGLLLARLLKKPFYATYHTAIPQYVGKLTEDDLLEDFAKKYTYWFYKMADKVFVPSKAFEDELRANGIKRERIVLMPRGVDIERFAFKNGNGQHDGYRLLYVGRISREKNLNILAEAYKMIERDDIDLTFVGDGPYLEELRDLLRGCRASFPGYLTGEALVRAYHESDLFIMPSTTDTFGNVILEAHACGVPTIVTDRGGPCENIVPDETGLIVQGNNALALKLAIESLLNKDRLADMGKKARAAVEGRSFESAFLKLWSFYSDGTRRGVSA